MPNICRVCFLFTFTANVPNNYACLWKLIYRPWYHLYPGRATERGILYCNALTDMYINTLFCKLHLMVLVFILQQSNLFYLRNKCMLIVYNCLINPDYYIIKTKYVHQTWSLQKPTEFCPQLWFVVTFITSWECSRWCFSRERISMITGGCFGYSICSKQVRPLVSFEAESGSSILKYIHKKAWLMYQYLDRVQLISQIDLECIT